MMMASMANPLAIGSSPASGGGSASTVVANATADLHAKWLMTHEQVQNSPSRRDGIPAEQELSLRQKAAHLIQDMGQRLRVSQLCINTAIVYMHRFYMYHSFQIFHRNGIAAASLFLSAKVEEQPRKVESIIQTLFASQSQRYPEVSSTAFQEQAQDLVFNENILLQTLGFDVAIEHPHVHIVNACNLVKACKDLVNTSYFLASNSLHLTTMCIQYRPTVVACFCIYLACKWSRWEIPESKEGRDWFYYVDKTVTMEMLEQLTNEYLVIYDNSPSRLKKQLNNCKGLGLTSKSPAQSASSASRPHPPQSLPGASASQIQRPSQHQMLQQQQHSSSSSSSHNQRSSAAHHNAGGKLPPPGMHGPSVAGGHPSSSSSQGPGTSALRHPHQQQRTDHHRPTAEPHFTAPHRTSGAAVLPPPPTSQQLQAYGMHATGTGNNNNNKSQQQYAHTMQHQQQPNHQKPRSSKDLPPKYMDPKIPAPPLSGGGIAPSASASASVSGSSCSKKNHYQQQSAHPTQPPPPPVQTQCPTNKYDMYKPQSSQPTGKATNYPTQQPPNYSQNMAGNHHHTQQSSTSSAYPQHHHQQQQQPPQHPPQRPGIGQHHSQTANAYSLNSDSQYGRPLAPPPASNNNSNTVAPTAAPNNDLLGMMMDTTDHSGNKSAKVPSIFSADYAGGPPTPKKDKTNRGSSFAVAAGAAPDANNRQFRQASSSAVASSATASKHHRGTDLAAGQMVSLPPPNTYVTPHQMQPSVKTEPPPSSSSVEYSKSSKRAHATGDDAFAGAGTFADYHRDTKVRKLEQTTGVGAGTDTAVTSYGSSMFSGLLKGNNSFNGTGIETNPDLVSSLLKESLCSNNTNSMYTNNLLAGSVSAADTASLDVKPPALNQHGSDMQLPGAAQSQLVAATAASADAAGGPAAGSANDSSDHEHKYKSEKKKKKKEKSKHREERKKHKKDKDRNRERSDTNDQHHSHRSTAANGPMSSETGAADAANAGHHNPIKIKIPKDKLHMSAGGALDAAGGGGGGGGGGFKITIPKDRIGGGGAADGGSSATSSGGGGGGGGNVGSGLKIKISKDVLLYNNHHHEAGGSGGYDSTNSHRQHSSSAGGGSSKKRDRDHGSSKNYHDPAQQQHQSGAGPSASNASKNMWVNH